MPYSRCSRNKVSNNGHNQVETELKQWAVAMRRFPVATFLILGTPDSGKSTIFYGINNYSEVFPLSKEYRQSLLVSIVRRTGKSMLSILRVVNQLGFDLGDISEVYHTISMLNDEEVVIDNIRCEKLSKALVLLGSHPLLQACVNETVREEFKETDRRAFNDLGLILNQYRELSDIELFKFSARQESVSEISFMHGEVKIQWLKPAQALQHSKFLHHFDNVRTILFVVDLSKYFDKTSTQYISEIQLSEDLARFQQAIQQPYFSKSPKIVMFNKMDIFEAKMLEYVPQEQLDIASRSISSRFTSLNTDAGHRVSYNFSDATNKTYMRFIFAAIYDILDPGIRETGSL